MPSRRAVATALETVSDFRDPRPELEQYLTPPELAAHICHLALMRGDIGERTVVDLGCGTGMLALGARYAGAESIVGVDVDPDALETAVENERQLFDRERVQWLRGDAARPPLCAPRSPPRAARTTVLSNPPFGAQQGNRHADRRFLEAISRFASVSYTIHNQGSLEFAESFAADHGGSVTDAFEATIPVDHRFDFHTAARSSIPVEVYRIEWTRS